MFVDQVKYSRPDFSEVKSTYRKIYHALLKATIFNEVKQIIIEYKGLQNKISDEYLIAKMKFKIYENKEYRYEIDYFVREMNRIAKYEMKINHLICASKFKYEIDDYFGEMYLLSLRSEEMLRKRKIRYQFYHESELVEKYSRLFIEKRFRLDINDKTLYGYNDLIYMLSSENRGEREKAFRLLDVYYVKLFEGLNVCFDELLKTHQKIAAGNDNNTYIEFVDELMNRTSISREEISLFRNSVSKYIIPIVMKLKKRIAEKNGYSTIMYFDENVINHKENLQMLYSKKDLNNLIDNIRCIIPDEYVKYFDQIEIEIDLKNEKSYITKVYLSEYEKCYVLGDFQGTLLDVFVLIQNISKCFQILFAKEYLNDCSVLIPTKIIEEALGYAFGLYIMQHRRVLGDKLKSYREFIIIEMLTNLLYYCLLDEFQEQVYLLDDYSTKNRRLLWNLLLKKYMPWENYANSNFFTSGRGWSVCVQNFNFHLKSIDYAISIVMAFYLFMNYTENQEAWCLYHEYCKCGGKKSTFDLSLITKNVENISQYIMNYLMTSRILKGS